MPRSRSPEDDLELARKCRGRPAIAVLNKQDLAGKQDVPRGTLEPYFKKIVPMCAKDAVGLQALTDAVADLLGTAQLDPSAAQLCSARQLSAATRARDALAEAILRKAGRLWAGRRRRLPDGRPAGVVRFDR